jgi:hypothetical protein
MSDSLSQKRWSPLRFVMLTAAVISFTMVWCPVVFGLLTHPVRASHFFDMVGEFWFLVVYGLSVLALCLSAVSMNRRHAFGILGFVLSLAVLTQIWMKFVPVV